MSGLLDIQDGFDNNQISDRDSDWLDEQRNNLRLFMAKLWDSPETIERTALLNTFTECLITDNDSFEEAALRLLTGNVNKARVLKLFNGGYMS